MGKESDSDGERKRVVRKMSLAGRRREFNSVEMPMRPFSVLF